MPSFDNDEPDWQIDPNGLYVATRGFLIRRGYCCGNQCRNCPYVNWHRQEGWQPGPAEAVQFVDVIPKVLDGVRQELAYHQQLEQHNLEQRDYHVMMVEHYQVLLERWEHKGE